MFSKAVTDHLDANWHSSLILEGKVVIDDALKAAIDKYYAEYGVKNA